ncbi:disease resistance protein RPV1-like [Macadamia integrifolia]|uniref:disease resistance protein RPV1-like n=1 Tax=Macadamia integrifolia TaxID=60698 RepID=UPI001C527FFD|nr:disease resistance protein RPV1-like [Macadamia integrifolia]
MQKWKKALREVGELDGWHVKEDTYEGELIKEVVNTVRSELNKRRSTVSNNLIGIQSHIEKMLKLLDIKSDKRTIVGIHGLGGIGKTTIARAIYYEVLNHFEGCCSFIADVRESAQQYKGLVHLQKQLISNILKQENQDIDSVEDGIYVIQQRFHAKKVLIVLDDVDQNIQVESLVGDHEWFGLGSKIIITSRDKDILISRKADGIYEPKVMDANDSLQLFSHHAFRRDQPPEDYLDLSNAMVQTTGGLPLALQVIGSSLFKKKKSIWESMLKKLQKVPDNDVMKSLKISYDALDDEEQQMFLDTACFSIGMDKDIACHIWDGCGFASQVGFDALCVKSLVTINEKNELRMHDQLRDLGREIVRQENKDDPGKRSRLCFQEEVLDVINSKKGTSNVKGLIIDFRCTSMSQCLMSEGFSAMTGLRLLRVDYAESSGNFTNCDLRWLSWRGCSDQYELMNFCPQRLAVLDLSHSSITKNWMGWNYIKKATNLKVLNLTSCDQLSSTPEVSANQLLEILILKGCRNLNEIDTSICCLTNLVILDMGDCNTLKGLPSEISKLTSLQKLNLFGCRSLVKLPEKLGRMISLIELDLTWCKSLLDLPSDIGQLTSLQNLELCRCESLVKLPEKLGRMISLTKLNLYYCRSLLNLPNEICQLTSLKNLNLAECFSLASLDFSHCSTSIGYITSGLPSSSLSSLEVSECTSIQYISGLPSTLIELNARYCESMVKLSSTSGGLKNLKTLCLYNCNSLKEIEGVDEKLDSLEYFNIGRCCSLKKLPKLTVSKNLTRLLLHENNCISDFEGEGMDSLEELWIWKCKSLRKIPYLRDSKRLRIVKIEFCPELSEIECLENYESLQTLSIVKASSLKKLPEDISTGLKNLSYLRISGCFSIERLPDLSKSKELRELHIGFCKYCKDCKDHRLCQYHGEIKDWESLTEIRGLEKLESLRELEIAGCIGIQRLPDLSNLKNLRVLSTNGCKKLAEIQARNGLEYLEDLDVRGCISLEKPPDLTKSKELCFLNGEECKDLTDIARVALLNDGLSNPSESDSDPPESDSDPPESDSDSLESDCDPPESDSESK